MTPKITKAMADAALKTGGKEKRAVTRPKLPEPRPIPQATDDLKGLVGAISELAQSLKEQLIIAQGQLQEAQRQNTVLSTMVTELSVDKPVRLKPVRDMDRNSATYLLVNHYDIVPVEYRKLHS